MICENLQESEKNIRNPRQFGRIEENPQESEEIRKKKRENKTEFERIPEKPKEYERIWKNSEEL